MGRIYDTSPMMLNKAMVGVYPEVRSITAPAVSPPASLSGPAPVEASGPTITPNNGNENGITAPQVQSVASVAASM